MLEPEHERHYWNVGKVVSGGDEVGMGAFAGPVVACIVSFVEMKVVPCDVRIDDSKKLSEKRRVAADSWIRENASFVGVGEGSVDEINSLGIRGALNLAFERAIENHNCDLLLIDGFEMSKLGVEQKAIIKGDGKVFSIAAASIVAKVYRDNLMVELSKKYEHYGWDRNKGYGTREHRKCLVKHGSTPLHRKQYVKNCLKF